MECKITPHLPLVHSLAESGRAQQMVEGPRDYSQARTGNKCSGGRLVEFVELEAGLYRKKDDIRKFIEMNGHLL